MDIRCYMDPDTGRPHFERHGVSLEEVIQILSAPGEDRPGREDSRVAIGRTRSGRCLRVIYVSDAEGGDLFVITAYELRGKPLTAYRRRMRRRRGKGGH
jgi:uncharacterized DUF497 family protein